MVEINFIGRLGNNLFQYVMGRILAEELNYTLSYKYSNGSHNTGINNFLSSNIKGSSHSTPVETLIGHVIDLKKILSNSSSRKIILNGFFQRYEYYRPYKERIRKWFVVPRSQKGNSVICHLRRDDYNQDITGIVNIEYYKNILDTNNFESVSICGTGITDQIKNSFKKYNPIYINNGVLEDFMTLTTFPNIIMSNSTFCWWATFLSNAQKIFFPLLSKGYWSPQRPDVDLKINDNNRYHFINAD